MGGQRCDDWHLAQEPAKARRFFGHVFGCEGNYGCAFGDDVIVRWVPPVAVMGGGGSEVIHPASMPR